MKDNGAYEPILGDNVYKPDCERTINSSDDHQSQLALSKQEKEKERTLRLVYYAMFVDAISLSILMSSLWPFLKRSCSNSA